MNNFRDKNKFSHFLNCSGVFLSDFPKMHYKSVAISYIFISYTFLFKKIVTDEKCCSCSTSIHCVTLTYFVLVVFLICKWLWIKASTK